MSVRSFHFRHIMKRCVLHFFYILQIVSVAVFVNVKAAPEFPVRDDDSIIGPSKDLVQFHDEGKSLNNANDENPVYSSYKSPKYNSFSAYDLPSSKRAVEDVDEVSNLLKFKKRRSPFGIVYNEGKPIGILEPIPQLYEYQNYQNDDPLMKKRDNLLYGAKDDAKEFIKRDDDELKKDSSFLDRYKSSNFNNNNKLARSSRLFGDLNTLKEVEKVEKVEKRSLMGGEELEDRKLATIETNLKEIMDDLGLINDEKKSQEKRDVQFEDEDLENGSNKIGISKETHPVNIKQQQKIMNNADASFAKDSKAAESIGNEEVNLEGENPKSKNKKIVDYRSEGENFIRKKRQQQQQQQTSSNKNDGADIVKGLETSGDLTVSGNKSPLASASAPVETESKHKNLKGENYEKRDQQAVVDDPSDEKRVQRKIQDQITQIKEEVKREIKSLKTPGAPGVVSTNSNVKSNDQTKRESTVVNVVKNEKPRSKRTLEDQESEQLSLKSDLNLNPAAFVPHFRQRRDTSDSDNYSKGNEGTDINKRAGGQETNTVHHNPKGYEFEKDSSSISSSSRTKRSSNEATNQQQQSLSHFQEGQGTRPMMVATGTNAARSLANNNGISKAAADSSRVIVTRSLRSNNGAGARTRLNAASLGQGGGGGGDLDSETLERLVSESASLSESVKSERGARLGEPRVEVELHTGSASKDGNQNNKKVAAAGASAASMSEAVVGETTRKREDSEKDASSGSGSAVAAALAAANNNKRSANKEQGNNKQQAMKAESAEGRGSNKDAAVEMAQAQEGDDNKFTVAKLARDGSTSNKGGGGDSSNSLEPKSVEIRTDAPDTLAGFNDDNNNNKISDRLASKGGGGESGSDLVEVVADADDEIRDAKENDEEAVGLDKRSPLNGAQAQVKMALAPETMRNTIRQERKSEPQAGLSLEDMQEMDSENTNKRRRRYASPYNYFPAGAGVRGKRGANNKASDANFMRFRNYRSDEDEADDESDEFDDDNFDDRTSNLAHKRSARSNLDDDLDGYAPNLVDSDYDQPYNPNHVKKRRNARLVSKINADVFDDPNYLYGQQLNGQELLARDKRHVDDLAALHSGGPVTRHLAAIRERKTHLETKNKNLGNGGAAGNVGTAANGQKPDETISGLSETDLFGGLPQSYEGELTRFKRVKRDGRADNDDDETNDGKINQIVKGNAG